MFITMQLFASSYVLAERIASCYKDDNMVVCGINSPQQFPVLVTARSTCVATVSMYGADCGLRSPRRRLGMNKLNDYLHLRKTTIVCKSHESRRHQQYAD
jgi:hypothetical protein